MTSLRSGLAALLFLTAGPALAQGAPQGIAPRVDKLEKEMKAVQRKVFPGGSPAFFEAEIAPPEGPATAGGLPASAPLNDLTARVDALEREVARLTGQVEQDEHRLTLLSEQAARDRAGFEARLTALEAGPAPAPTPDAPPAAEPLPAPTKPVPAKTGKAPTTTKPVATKPAAAAAAADPAPAAAGADPAEDAYMAGYRLWQAKKYPEAEAALKQVAAKYPKHKRASYAQNLLGRAYLDEGNPATAAETFYANYQKNPRGERAPDSLYYLGQALVELKKPADACRVYDELDKAYGATLSEPLKGRIPAARAAAKCK